VTTCPMCGGTNLKPIEDKLYRCGNCNMLTDGIDDGTVGRGRPEDNRLGADGQSIDNGVSQ